MADKFFRIFKRLNALETQTKELRSMAQVTQAQLDALATSLGAMDTAVINLTGTVGTIASEVAALQAANPTLDLSGVTNAAAKAQTDVGALGTAIDSLQSALAPPAA